MNRTLLLLGFIACTSCRACTGVGDFEVTRETAEVVIDGTNNPLNNLLPIKVIPDLELEFDLDSELEKQNAKGARRVHLTGLVLRITDTRRPAGDEDDFDFLDRIEFYVSSVDESLPERLLASMDPVPSGREEIELDTDAELDLKPYAEAGIILTTKGKGSVPPDDVSVIGVVTIEVETL